jgi:hypothetical protein
MLLIASVSDPASRYSEQFFQKPFTGNAGQVTHGPGVSKTGIRPSP